MDASTMEKLYLDLAEDPYSGTNCRGAKPIKVTSSSGVGPPLSDLGWFFVFDMVENSRMRTPDDCLENQSSSCKANSMMLKTLSNYRLGMTVSPFFLVVGTG